MTSNTNSTNSTKTAATRNSRKKRQTAASKGITAPQASQAASALQKAAETQAAPQIKTVTAYASGNDHKSRYQQFTDHAMFSAYTLAALLVSGMGKVNKTGIGAGTGKGNLMLFKGLTSPKAYSYWSSRYDSEKGKLNRAGLAAVEARLADSRNQYHTSLDLVKQVETAMKAAGKGKVEHKGRTFNFDSKVTVKA